MEELQLALTANRVEQRNFGLWLNSWQVGKVLQALVVDQAPSGQLLLRMGAHRITATTDIPVQKGAVLKLEIASLTPRPILKVITPATTQTPGQMQKTALELQLPGLLARQGTVSNPLSALTNAAGDAKLLALLNAGSPGSPLQSVLKHLYQPNDLNTGSKLQSAVQRSGLFLEAKQQLPSPAAQASTNTAPTPSPSTPTSALQSTSPIQAIPHSGDAIAPVPEPDLKADLQRLLQQIRQLSQNHTTATDPVRERLLTLGDKIDSALSHITLQQIACQSSDSKGQTCFLIDLPVQTGEHTSDLSLEIERDSRRKNNNDEEDDSWRVNLRMRLPQLGDIDIDIRLHGSSLSLSMHCQQSDTVQILQHQLLPLESRLEQVGFEIAAIHARQRHSNTENLTLTRHLNIGVDERI